MKTLRKIIQTTLEEAAKKSKPKSATLAAAYDSDLRIALFNLKQRNIIKSNSKFRKKGNEYRVTVKYNGTKADLKDSVINFYGRFVRVI